MQWRNYRIHKGRDRIRWWVPIFKMNFSTYKLCMNEKKDYYTKSFNGFMFENYTF